MEMATPQRSPASRPRPGFSAAELLIVIVIMGVLAAVAIPKLTAVKDRNGVESVREQLVSTVTVARSAARQRSMRSAVRIDGNTLSAWTFSPTTGDTVWLVQPSDLNAESGVHIETADAGSALIEFDTRGFANRADSVRVWRLRAGTRVDSVCIGPLGHLYKRNCQQ
jgi:prepilin-type N-terminal cleavage/methylation domain-containing protein